MKDKFSRYTTRTTASRFREGKAKIKGILYGIKGKGKVLFAIISEKAVTYGSRLRISMLALPPGFCGDDRGLTEAEWNDLRGRVKEVLASYYPGLPIQRDEEWSSDSKFWFRAKGYVLFEELVPNDKPTEEQEASSIPDRLRQVCNVHIFAKIAWPHRLLHEAAEEIERLQRLLDAEEAALKQERAVRKNLQNVIVSRWGAESVSRCVAEIREVEDGLGPLGPINDYRLAQIISSNVQLPAELVIAQERDKIRALLAGNDGQADKKADEEAEKEEQGAVVSTRCFACGCVTPGVYHCVRGRFYCSSCYHGLPENYGKPTQITPL